ncbi:MAG TPA: heme lyase CcmF/NrfE family subunit [Thermoanaerobaculia bacterium]|nr:heme lyase CcmF/NrfE family subunit [Thermoanaerobaculia bacterium]
MTPALGQGLVLLGLLLCTIGAPVGFVAGARRSELGLLWTRRLALGFALAMIAANVLMVVALVRHDFSVSYVAQVGSTTTPLHITIVSLWSSLEGSILFWGMILGLYTAGVAILQWKRGHDDYLAYTLGTILTVGIFFSFLIAGAANPFKPVPPPIPMEGPGPNPLLQNHLLMIVHPPTLYLGYVGMTVPFAMAVAALLRGQLGPTWLRPLRNWLLVPTSFLTLGIMLGGWWSYEVLGWGGYWAWDPVENASLLPWLTAIAALHSAIVLQRRGTLKAWTVVLIMISFLLTILGTFLTRSGVVNSVHAFTQSAIGPMFLAFLGVAAFAVVILLALRVDRLGGPAVGSPLPSRESAFLVNNLLLLALMFTVLVGTLYPILAEAVRGVKVSVGVPWYNRMGVPIFLGLILLMGLGPALPWGSGDSRLLRRALLWPLPAAGVALLIALALGGRGFPILFSAALFGYTLWVTADQGLRPARTRVAQGESPPAALKRSTELAPRRLGAYIVHFGVLVTFLSIAISSSYQVEREAQLAPGTSTEIDGYTLTFLDARLAAEPHVTRQIARIDVSRNGRSLGVLEPSINFYPTQREPIGTPKVRTRLTHDLYLTLMNVSANSAGLRAIVTPAVLWIWLGVLMMVAGTAVCLLPPRLPVRRAVAAAAGETVGEGVDDSVAEASAGG